jgi:hypothetical protein
MRAVSVAFACGLMLLLVRPVTRCGASETLKCDAAGTGAMVASFGSNASTGATGACREQIRSGRETIGWVPCHRSCFLNVDVGYSRAPLSCGSQKAQLAHYQREAFAMVQRLLEVKQSDAQQQVSLCAGKAAVSASVLF